MGPDLAESISIGDGDECGLYCAAFVPPLRAAFISIVIVRECNVPPITLLMMEKLELI